MRVFGKNTLWLLLDRAGLKVGAMLAGLVLLGYLGPANVGIYSTAIAVGCVLNALLDLGLTRYAARAVAADRSEARPVLALSLASTGVALVIEVCAALIAHRIGNWYWACLFAGFIFTNLDGTASALGGVLSADLRSRAVLPGSVLNALGVVCVIALVVKLRLSVLALLVGLAVKSSAVLLFRLWQLRSLWPAAWRYFKPRAFAALARRARVFFSYSLTQMGYEKVAIVSFALVAGRDQVGLFSSALLIAGLFPSFTYAASDALLPVMTRLYEDGRISDLQELRRRLLNLLLYLSVPAGITLAVFAHGVCGVLGERFLLAAPILSITASRSVLSVLDNFLGQAGLTAVARVRERRDAQFAGFLLCAGLTLVLGANWGTRGAAIATLLADLLIVAQYFRIFQRIGLPVECPALWTALAAGTVMTLACFLLPHSRWDLSATLAAMAYIATLGVVAPRGLAEGAATFRQCFLPARPIPLSNGTAP